MNNNLAIKNRSSFVNLFLNSIGKVAEDCIIQVEDEQISSLCSTSDGTLVQHIKYKNNNGFVQTLNIPDIKRFHKIVSCVETDTIDLAIQDNSVSYKSPTTRFKFYLLDDGILSGPPISVEKINGLDYDTEFNIQHSNLLELIKGSTFANETEKLYIYTDENNHVYGELTDKEKPNMDSYCIRLTQDNNVSIKPLAFNFENIRIVSSTRCNSLKFRVNTSLSVVRVDIDHEDCYISYIISALIK